MKKKKTPKKNYAFVDNANVMVSVSRQGRHIDRGKLKGWLERRWNVGKVFMLMGYHPDYESMYEYFRSLGYELVFKPMNIGENIELKGNIDTDLVLRVMKERTKYDKAILLTGDGDFLSLVNHLKDKKKLGQIIVPHSGRYSHFLEEAAGEYITSLTGKKRWLAYIKGEKKKSSSNPKESKKNDTKIAKQVDQKKIKNEEKKDDSRILQNKKQSNTNKNTKPGTLNQNIKKKNKSTPTSKQVATPNPQKKPLQISNTQQSESTNRQKNKRKNRSRKKLKSENSTASNSKSSKPVSQPNAPLKKVSPKQVQAPKQSSSPSIQFSKPSQGAQKKKQVFKEPTKKSFSSNTTQKDTSKRKTKVDPSHNTRFFD